MNNTTKTIDKDVETLAKITNSIKSIYNKLKIAEDPKEIAKLKENLTLVTEIEDSLYEKILNSEDFEYNYIANIPRIIENLNLKKSDDIIFRISMYINQVLTINPFKSTELDLYLSSTKNYYTIEAQGLFDYQKSYQHTLNEELNKQTSSYNKRKITIEKYEHQFEFKFITYLMSKEKTSILNGRERCIIFNHDEEEVNSIYRNFAFSLINQIITEILSYDDNLIDTIKLKSCIALLNNEELFALAKNFFDIIEQEKNKELVSINPNCQKIVDIISEAFNNRTNEKVKNK